MLATLQMDRFGAISEKDAGTNSKFRRVNRRLPRHYPNDKREQVTTTSVRLH